MLEKWRFKSLSFFGPVLQNIYLISDLLNSFSFSFHSFIISSTVLKNFGGDTLNPPDSARLIE